MTIGQRGKWAESAVRNELMKLETDYVGFTFNRIPDARGGFMQPAAADFQWFFRTDHCKACGRIDILLGSRNGLIEVKEVEHEYRLPYLSFSADKVARMWKRQLAGCETIVLIAHKLKGMRAPDVKWRAAPLDFFRGERAKGVGSWDLREVPYVNYKELLRSIVE